MSVLFAPFMDFIEDEGVKDDNDKDRGAVEDKYKHIVVHWTLH